MEFLQAYLTWGNLAFVGVVVLIGAVLWRYEFITMANIKEWAKQFILQAEAFMKTETGKGKMAYVIGKIYNNLPSLAKLFFTEQKIEQIIQKVFDEISEIVIDEDNVEHIVPHE